MDYRLESGWVIFDDGTRIRSISGAQEDLLGASGPDLSSIVDASTYADATQVDFVLNIGYTPPDTEGGVTFGDPAAAGYVGLSDAIRSGTEADAYVGTVAVNSSLSDVLRSSGQTPQEAFNPDQFNPNVNSSIPDFNVMDVVDSVVSNISKLTGTAISAFSAFGKSGGTTSSKATSGSPNTQPSLWNRLFGGPVSTAPGASGNPVSPLLLGGAVAAFALVIFLLVGKRS